MHYQMTGPGGVRRADARGFRDPFTLVAGIALTTILGGAMSQNRPKAPKPPPAPPPPAAMPTPDDQAVELARQRSIADQRRRRGRMSTILSDQGLADQPLGGM